MTKKLGILGGMGPYATLDFLRFIYTENKTANRDFDHIHTIVNNHNKLPSRTRCVLFGEESPATGMKEALINLTEAGCDLLAVPCNSAHYFYNDVCDGSDLNWVNMIESVSDAVLSLNCTRPMILGGYVTIHKRLYSKFITGSVYLKESENLVIYELIENIKTASQDYDLYCENVLKCMDRYKFDSIILACTELTEVTEHFSEIGLPIFDSNKIYAQKLISLCDE